MSNRTTKVTLTAQVQGYVEGMEKAAKATRETGSEAEKLAQKQQAFEQLGRGAMVAGGAIAAGLLLSTKAAIDWESAWAGVTKTVDGNEQEMAALEGQLRSLTSVLPATHEEIAAVAEAAGQLGIKRENVAAFTKTMIDLGETTNLSADQAATSLARFTNIMGTSQSQVSNLGSAMVDLGNNYATTEAEIMDMAMRLAGAGKQIGMSEGEVLGLSAALSSVGIEAEAGGSAMSKVMIDIAASAEKGGARLEMFAKVSGVSADAFAAKWKSDPGAALAMFVEGLATAESQGMSTLGVLEELGITEVRMRDALLRSASASDQFTAAMQTGNKAFKDNTALTAEAEKRYETTAAKLSMMKNSIVDTAITLGETFLPAVESAAEGLSGLAEFVGSLPEPMIAAVAWIGAVGAAALLTGGMFMAALPKYVEFKASLDALNISAATAKGSLAAMAPAALAVGLAVVAHSLNDIVTHATGARVAADELAASLKKTDDVSKELSGMLAGSAFAKFSNETARAKNSLSQLNSDVGSFMADMQGSWFGEIVNFSSGGFGLFGNEAANAKKNIAELDKAMTQMVAAGQADAAAVAYEEFAALAKEAGWSAERIAQALPGYSAALEGNAAAAEASGEGTKTAADEYVEAADKANQLAGELMKLLDSYNELNGIGQTAEQQNARMHESFSKIQEYVAKAQEGVDGYALSLDESTAAGSANRAMLADHAADVLANAQAQFELESATLGAEQASANYEARLATGRQQIYDTALALTGNAEAAQKLTDKILAMPSQKEIEILADTTSASNSIDALIALTNTRVATINVRANLPDLNGAGSGSGRMGSFADGGIVENGIKTFAAGGFEPGIYPYTPGGIHKFAEEFGEAYISMDPARRQRSVGVWQETGRRLGVAQSAPAAPQIKVVVNAAPGMDENRIVDRAVKRIERLL